MNERFAARDVTIGRLTSQINELADKLMLLSNETAIRTVERRIEELERERLILSQKPKETPPPAAHVGTALERIIPVLKNPYQTWKDGDTHSKRLVTCLVFPSRLPYVRNEGFGTAEIALPFLLLASPGVTVSTLVGDDGLEPSTSSLSVTRSNHLS